MTIFSNRKRGPKSGHSIGLDYSELNRLVKQLKDMDGNIKETTEMALKKSQQYATKNLHSNMKRHHLTGATENSIVEEPPVIWVGNAAAQIDVGFDITNGGLAAIFLMYGTPRMEKDQKLFNSLYGSGTHKEFTNIQADVFFKAIGRLGG